jgi:hypothetical protein
LVILFPCKYSTFSSANSHSSCTAPGGETAAAAEDRTASRAHLINLNKMVERHVNP